MDSNLKRFCYDLPKIELHAHLIGSCSENTIKKLIELNPGVNFSNNEEQGMKEIFKKFDFLHELSNSLESLSIITKDVIEEFAYENVRYLELRTTPRSIDAMTTKYDYVNTVVKAILDTSVDLNKKGKEIIVKLLLSIDRSKSLEDAWTTLELVQKFGTQNDPVVIGLDLSGNPYSNGVEKFIPVLNLAKEKRIKISMHIAEIEGRPEEAELLYSINPDRLGHATYLQGQFSCCQEFVDKVVSDRTPIELCITSNLMSATVKEISDHQFKFWWELKHPCVICTDDKGVFKTSLSNEYYLVAKNFNFSPQQIWNLSFDSIEYIFADEAIKKKLQLIWDNVEKEIFLGINFIALEPQERSQ